jgi:hypothetical protein
MNSQTPLSFLPPETVPPQVEVAFRAMAYCRSLTDPQSLGLTAKNLARRALTAPERGLESAAINTVRNYITGELTFGSVPLAWVDPPLLDDPPRGNRPQLPGPDADGNEQGGGSNP